MNYKNNNLIVGQSAGKGYLLTNEEYKDHWVHLEYDVNGGTGYYSMHLGAGNWIIPTGFELHFRTAKIVGYGSGALTINIEKSNTIDVTGSGVKTLYGSSTIREQWFELEGFKIANRDYITIHATTNQFVRMDMWAEVLPDGT